jgi:hypothetical protein
MLKKSLFYLCTLVLFTPFAFAQEQSILVNGFSVTYSSENTEISKISIDQDLVALHLEINPQQDDTLTITIPRDLLDAKISDSDDDFYLLVDGVESVYEQTSTEQTRTLVIPIKSYNTELTIIGTYSQKPSQIQSTSQEKSGCLIATATYDSELSTQVQLLREIRDNVLFSTSSGTTFLAGFNEFYYSFSPTLSDWERQSPAFKELVQITITPLLSTLSILNHVDIDSEQEILGYGIGIILLNAAIYFVAPAILVMAIRQKLRR